MADGRELGTWGRIWRGGVDRLLPGQQRGTDGRLIGSQVGRGVVGRIASVGSSFLGGPGLGAFTNRLAGNWVDRGNPLNFGPGTGPLAEGYRRITGTDGAPVDAPTVPGATNLGLGTGVNPYQGWTNYMADPGSRDNFGNNYIGGGYTGAGFNPSSAWGRNLLNSPNTNPGSIQNFGNNVDALRGGRGESSGRSVSDNGLARLGFGRPSNRFGDARQFISDRNPYQST